MKNNAYDFFLNSYNKNRLSHLYLIVGPKGSGKLKLAKEISALIINKDDEYTKTQIFKEEHPNFFHIEKDGLSIKKQQIINLQEEFSKTSLTSGARVYVISDIELMSNSAANSLLKFMEEPENNKTYGFLLSKSTNEILPTIISRSQVIKLEQVDKKNVIKEFIDNQINNNYAYFLASITSDIDEAITLTNDLKMIELFTFTNYVLTNLFNKDFSFIIDVSNYRSLFNTDRNYAQIFTNLLFMYILDLHNILKDENIYFNNYLENIKLQSSKVSEIALIKFLNVLKDVILKQKANLNIDLLLDLIGVSIEKFRKDIDR